MVVGRIVGTFGVRGDVKVSAADPSAIALGRSVHLRAAGLPPQATTVIGVRPHGRGLVVRLASIGSVEAARKAAGALICVPKSALATLPHGWYRLADLLGLTVEDARSGVLGRVVEVRRYPSCAMLVLEPGERLVPLLAAYEAKVDLAGATIRVRLPDGFDEIG